MKIGNHKKQSKDGLNRQPGIRVAVSALCLAVLGVAVFPRLEASANEPSGQPSLLERLLEEATANPSTVEDAAVDAPGVDSTVIDTSAASILQQAAEQAEQAEQLALRATTAADWDGVVALWLDAIALAQSISPTSPSRIVAQRQLRGYIQQLSTAQQRSEQVSVLSDIPSFGSALLDAQMAGYLSYVATVGTPDILIVGSSRALQGIDPQAMQRSLADQGYADLNVFNFSVNGATAQVVNFIVTQLLPEPLPAVIVWGDGSRAFNDGRRDRTWESLLASPGYQVIRAGTSPFALFSAAFTADPAAAPATPVRLTQLAASPESLPAVSDLDALGFAAVSDRFAPQTYYQQFPKVAGRYDGAYLPFTLEGAQAEALSQLAAFSTAQNSQLIFVNLPLSGSYLDADRRYFERQFQQFLRVQSTAHSFEVVDLLTQWQAQPDWFADPSHINQEGAAAIATQLAQNPALRSALVPPPAAPQLEPPSEPPSGPQPEPPSELPSAL
ncbi:MAG: hypothetical protein WBD47_04185 [Phormidesmis sp.]